MSLQGRNIIGICIPTYNRSAILKQNLMNIIQKVGAFSVPIYISDNASPDNTKEIVDEMKKTYPFIIYSRNKENVGSDKNFELVLKLCQEQYAWLLGDDDTITGDFDKFYESIIKDTYDAIIISKPKRVNYSVVYTNKDDILKDLAGGMTWISSLIINRELVKTMNFDRYTGSRFVHTGALLEALCKENVKVLSYYSSYSNMLINSMQKYYSGFSDEAFDIFTENWMNMICSLPYQYTYSSKLIAISNLPTAPFRTITLILYRTWGVYDYARIKKQARIIKSIGYKYYYKMLLVAVMPMIVARGIIRLGMFVRKKKYGF